MRIVSWTSSLAVETTPDSRFCAMRKIFCSALSSRFCAGVREVWTSSRISPAAEISSRMVALSRTTRAQCTAFAALGTPSASCTM